MHQTESSDYLRLLIVCVSSLLHWPRSSGFCCT